MQENYSNTPGVHTTNSDASTQSQTNSMLPALYLLISLVIAVIAFSAGYLLGGSSKNEYAPQEITNPEVLLVETNAENPLAMIDEVTEAVPYTYMYNNSDLGFSIKLPEKYSVLTTKKIVSPDNASITTYFNLPIKSESPEAMQMIFSIAKTAPNSEGLEYADQMGQLLAETSDGYSFYYFHPLDVAIDTSQPEYALFMSLVDQDLFPIVKEGFELL